MRWQVLQRNWKNIEIASWMNFFLKRSKTVFSSHFKTENHPGGGVGNLFSQPAGRQLSLRNSFWLLFYFWSSTENHLGGEVGSLSCRPVGRKLSLRNSFRLLFYFWCLLKIIHFFPHGVKAFLKVSLTPIFLLNGLLIGVYGQKYGKVCEKMIEYLL